MTFRMQMYETFLVYVDLTVQHEKQLHVQYNWSDSFS